MIIEELIKSGLKKAILDLYNTEVDEKLLQIQDTRKDFDGDLTIVVFPLLRTSKKAPEQTAEDLGQYLKENVDQVDDFNVIKGFLNIVISKSYWLDQIVKLGNNDSIIDHSVLPEGKSVMVEYSSPNTNKPLHLGHIRNNLLGYSIAEILKAANNNVTKVNLVNDRGIHICKSMLAWQRWGNGEEPTAEKKGDKLVGDYYVKFDQEYKKEISDLVSQGSTEDDAKKSAPLILEAQEMLRKWEAGDEDVVALWKKMNTWVLDGFDITYKNLGVDFDKVYFESDTYKLGKALVTEGLKNGAFFQKEDQSVWADLTDKKLDEKLLLRSDGTSVYMTQDIGTAHQRFSEFNIDQHVYVVGNEQIYHFQVLKIVLEKLGFSWANNLFHLSYGMVELPEGKMKSREGTVVDADDLLQEMIDTAREMSTELGKLDGYSEEEKEDIYRIIGLGALKYFILKVDPKKNMTFNPKESIDFNGNTGPFIQYSYTRIKSILRKAEDNNISISGNFEGIEPEGKEIELIKMIYNLSSLVVEASQNMSPALIANYVYDLAKEFNQFYHDFPILKEEDQSKKEFRLFLIQQIARTIKQTMSLLGIEVPERM